MDKKKKTLTPWFTYGQMSIAASIFNERLKVLSDHGVEYGLRTEHRSR